MVIEEVRPVFAPPNFFFDPISSFAARAIENLRENAPPRENRNTYNLVVCPPKATKLKA